MPIVEPEILIEGTHTATKFAEVTERVLAEVYYQLAATGVHLEGSLLKPQMMMPGVDCEYPMPSPHELAEVTSPTVSTIPCLPHCAPTLLCLSLCSTPWWGPLQLLWVRTC